MGIADILILNKQNSNYQIIGDNTVKFVSQKASIFLWEQGMNASILCKMEMFGVQLFLIRLLHKVEEWFNVMRDSVLSKK